MKIYTNPPVEMWSGLMLRPSQVNNFDIEQVVQNVFDAVKISGDGALYDFTSQFDGVEISNTIVPKSELQALAAKVSEKSKQAIDQAYENIKTFHAEQVLKPKVIETQPGVQCWRESRPIEKIGLYVPGGSAPLVSTLLMLGAPAQLAGCKELYVVTPPAKDSLVAPAIAYSALKVGVTKIFRVGGAQAIAALCVGTETIPKVNKVFGPGNQYVTAAKALAGKYDVAIDMPAGPSEVLVLADDSAIPKFVAADLLSQAEHGPDSQVVLVTTSKRIQKEVMAELEKQLAVLPRKEIAAQALENSLSVYFDKTQSAIDFTNCYGSEHVIASCDNADSVAGQITVAGSVFLGNYSPESAGDYASGTNHTLPTAGWARSSGGVSLDSFVKKITFQKITKQGLTGLAPTITELASLEGLEAHAQAVKIRLT